MKFCCDLLTCSSNLEAIGLQNRSQKTGSQDQFTKGFDPLKLLIFSFKVALRKEKSTVSITYTVYSVLTCSSSLLQLHDVEIFKPKTHVFYGCTMTPNLHIVQNLVWYL